MKQFFTFLLFIVFIQLGCNKGLTDFSNSNLSQQDGMKEQLIPYRVENSWGYASHRGTVVVDPQFQEASIMENGVAFVKKNDLYGYLNNRGKQIIPFRFEKANQFGFGVAFVTENGRKFCIDPKGKEVECVIGCGGTINNYRNIEFIIEDGYVVLIGDLNEDGTFQKIHTKWTQLLENNKGYAAVKKDNLWAIINSTLTELSPYQYESVELNWWSRNNDYFKVKKDDKYGFLDGKGDEIIKPIYYKVDFFYEGLAKVWIDEDYWGYIDERGKEFFKR